MKRFIFLSLAVLLVFVNFCGAEEKGVQSIVGKWYWAGDDNTKVVYNFSPNNKGEAWISLPSGENYGYQATRSGAHFYCVFQYLVDGDILYAFHKGMLPPASRLEFQPDGTVIVREYNKITITVSTNEKVEKQEIVQEGNPQKLEKLVKT